MAHGPSCSAACGIFPDQGSILYPLHWQADSQPLRHQGSPVKVLFQKIVLTLQFKKDIYCFDFVSVSDILTCSWNLFLISYRAARDAMAE